ncbi:MAG: hypothetical protein LBK96_06450 [Prevotellaceae bacterium]|jgi:hypothetical protein|nr:hypothetical protein [Prevotellaceae bacterium]
MKVKILFGKAVAAFWKGAVGTLCIIAVSFFIMSSKCTDNEKENEPVSLKDTKWKLIGFVDTRTGNVTDAKPKCDRCYTLTFDTDSTASGWSLMNTVRLDLKPVLRMWVATDAYDLQNGNITMFYEAMESLESYTIESKVMKFFYYDHDNKYYLLFKLVEEIPIKD